MKARFKRWLAARIHALGYWVHRPTRPPVAVCLGQDKVLLDLPRHQTKMSAVEAAVLGITLGMAAHQAALFDRRVARKVARTMAEVN